MDEHRQKVDREFDALLAGHSRELETLTQRQVKDHERQVKNAAAVEARRRRQLQQQQEAELKQFQTQQKKDYARWKDELRKVCVRTSYEEAARPFPVLFIQSNLLKWTALGPHYKYPVR